MSGAYTQAVPVPGWRVYLRLGRVSNLPTVWTDLLAGAALAGARPSPGSAALLLAAVSLFYTAGMFLNDAFDRGVDARQRPERPIPSGQVATGRVFALGFGMLALGWTAVLAHVVLIGGSAGALVAAGALAAAIVAYDAWHKDNPWSPVLMGLCRALVYATAALAVASALPPRTWLGALTLLAYVAGLTYAAKQESLGSPRTVALLIAGITLLDAGWILAAGFPTTAAVAALGFPLTLFLQRYIRGT